MDLAHFVIGSLGVVLGITMIVLRERLEARARARSRPGTGVVPANGWVAAGVLFIGTGLIQFANGVMS